MSRVGKRQFLNKLAIKDKMNKQSKKEKLKQIIQVSEQHETYRNNHKENKGLLEKEKTTCFEKCWKCLKKTVMYFAPRNELSLSVDEDSIIKAISELKKDKNFNKVVLPQQQSPKRKTIVLDLDGVLICSVFTKPEKYDFNIEIPLKEKKISVFTTVRFGAQSFLFELSKDYEIIIYTTRRQPYTDRILSLIDPKKRISHVLYKERCIIINKVFSLKNIQILGRDEKNTIIIDHDPLTSLLQPDNFYRIKKFQDGIIQDRELLRLMSFLKEVSKWKRMTPIQENFQKFMDKEINLKQQVNEKMINIHENEEREKENKKRKYGHHKSNSEVDSLAKTEDAQSYGEISSSFLKVKPSNH